MPITGKGKKIMSDFMSRYGAKKGKSVAYATAQKKGPSSRLYKLFHGGK